MNAATTILVLLLFLPVVSCFGQPESGTDRGFELVGESFVAVRVPDDSAAAAWYRWVFGLEEVNHLADENGRYSIRVLSGAGLVVELIAQRGTEAPPAQHLGLFKTGFFVDDIDAAHEWMRRNEVDVDDRVFLDEALDLRSFVFRDPNGNRLQFFSRE